MRLNLLAVLACAALFAGNAQAQIEIQWWHSMGGALGDALNGLASKFNASQKDYKVVPTFKGTYPESMTAAIAAFRAGNAPHLLQVFEVGTATMMSAKGAIVPVATVMANAKEPFDPKAYLPTGSGYYTGLKGNMLSFPFNSWTGGFYINRDPFKKARLDPHEAPRAWKDGPAAADFHDGRSLGLGEGRQEARGLQGRGEVLRCRVAARGADGLEHHDRLRADYPGFV